MLIPIMTYALIEDQKVLKFPYSFDQLKEDNPTVSFPAEPPEDLLNEWGMVRVKPTSPAVDFLTEVAEPKTPAFVNGELCEQWVVRAATAEELQRRFEEAANYKGFYNSLIASSVYQVIRSKAASSLPLTVSCTEFMAAFADAKIGFPNTLAIQASFDNILRDAGLDADQKETVMSLMVEYGLNYLYRLGG
jgi:hypothetical protein